MDLKYIVLECYHCVCQKCHLQFYSVSNDEGYKRTGLCFNCQVKYCCLNCYFESDLFSGFCYSCYNRMKCLHCKQFNMDYYDNKTTCKKCMKCLKNIRCIVCFKTAMVCCDKCDRKYCGSLCFSKDWKKHKKHCLKK